MGLHARCENDNPTIVATSINKKQGWDRDSLTRKVPLSFAFGGKTRTRMMNEDAHRFRLVPTHSERTVIFVLEVGKGTNEWTTVRMWTGNREHI